MRLIDADRACFELERFYNGYTGELRKVASEALDLVCMMPEVDAVPVVRCKDCRKLRGNGTCNITEMTCNPDDFCSYGERRKTDAEE